MWRSRMLSLGVTTTPAHCDRPDNRVVASDRTSSIFCWRSSWETRASIVACSSGDRLPTSISASTKNLRPISVGIRPALVWGE